MWLSERCNRIALCEEMEYLWWSVTKKSDAKMFEGPTLGFRSGETARKSKIRRKTIPVILNALTTKFWSAGTEA